LALLGEMAAGLVHELNQPLNIIRMATERTQGKFQVAEGDADSETVGSQLEIIAGQTERMADTIQSMRIFSRDDYGRKVAFDPAQSVVQAVGWLRSEFEERAISLEVDTPARCGRVFGEPSRFEQVIVNLLINARDAVEQNADGSVTSDPARNIRVTVTDDPVRERVTIAVRDNGQGILAAHIDRVFEPFFTTKDPGSGTGLGLSISYGIVSGMNGTLLAENTDDGVLFRVELPRIMPADVAGASSASIDLE
jgi:two-component system, cell cycle sensor histidine kinase and response regulator CckA